jgi:hypothetical protein
LVVACVRLALETGSLVPFAGRDCIGSAVIVYQVIFVVVTSRIEVFEISNISILFFLGRKDTLKRAHPQAEDFQMSAAEL